VESLGNSSSQSSEALPADDLARSFAIARPMADEGLLHFGVAGDTYTILVSGADTAGRYCLIDMLVPTGGGPPPHRHDFEEMFSVLEGEIEVTFRGEAMTVRAGETINVPANAPHFFKNVIVPVFAGRAGGILCGDWGSGRNSDDAGSAAE
jgi:quercetin dioxygenase-like cupin family protein